MRRLKKIMGYVDTYMCIKFLVTYLLPILLSVAQLLIEKSINNALLVIIVTGVPTTVSYILAEFIDFFYSNNCILDPFYLSFILLFIIIELVVFMIYLLLNHNTVVGYILLFLSITLYILGYNIFNRKGD